MLLLNINRKAYTGSSLMPLHFDLSELERSMPISLRFRRLISRRGAELSRMLLLNTNREPYMGSEMHASQTYNPNLA